MECKMEGFDRVQEDGGVGGEFHPHHRGPGWGGGKGVRGVGRCIR